MTPSPDDTVDLRLHAPSIGPLWLRFEPPSGMAIAVPLRPGDAVDVGTRRGLEVTLADPTVSSRHCRVAHHGEWVELVDLGSRNGVVLGGARVERAQLSIGTSFELGRTVVRVEPPTAPEDLEEGEPLPGMIGNSSVMRRLGTAVRRLAGLRLPVLVRGESGTGKDLVAQALHAQSTRASRPFVAINAATIARELAESELFGHQRGAFTGAHQNRRGAFREAHGGTLFLDEIAALPLELQAKLLRVVEEGLVRPLGAEAPARVDVRLVAATCEPLEAMVAARTFRLDLYERLAVCVVRVPPLRDRPEDIAGLVRHLLATSELGSRVFSREATALLAAERWPGNVRELRNVVVQAALRAKHEVAADHVAAVLGDRRPPSRRKIDPAEALRIFEESGRNASAAARRAALPRSTLRDLLRAAQGTTPGFGGESELASEAPIVTPG